MTANYTIDFDEHYGNTCLSVCFPLGFLARVGLGEAAGGGLGILPRFARQPRHLFE